MHIIEKNKLWVELACIISEYMLEHSYIWTDISYNSDEYMERGNGII
jgi:hypothetical protein